MENLKSYLPEGSYTSVVLWNIMYFVINTILLIVMIISIWNICNSTLSPLEHRYYYYIILSLAVVGLYFSTDWTFRSQVKMMVANVVENVEEAAKMFESAKQVKKSK
jgi:hypothetical protein